MLWHSAYSLGQISQHLVIKIKPNILWVKGEGGGEGIEMVSVRGGWGFYANFPMGWEPTRFRLLPTISIMADSESF
jgi:hypothetical protein